MRASNVCLFLSAAAMPVGSLSATQSPVAGEEAEAEAPAAADPPASTAPTADPDLRTFGGQCLHPPAGQNKQVGALAALLIPQLVGAGIDALSGALDAAGTDKVRAKSAVVPLEYAVTCVQVAKLSGTGRDWITDEGKAKEKARLRREAPLMLELFLRQSTDGSALLITPTMLNYRQTVNGHQTGSTRRNLYATITIADSAGEHPSQVTVPLGDFKTRSEPYYFDPMMAPISPKDDFVPLGSANSVWIPNPFVKRAAGAGEGGGGGGGETRAERSNDRADRFGNTDIPPSGGTPRVAPTPPAPPSPQPAVDPTPLVRGDPIAPISITVVITETRPGNGVAKALAGILKGSKQGVVDLADPAKRREARETEQAAADTATTNWATARSDYSKALATYCAPDSTAESRKAAAPDLHTAQVKLTIASRGAKVALPFTALVDPDTGRGMESACGG